MHISLLFNPANSKALSTSRELCDLAEKLGLTIHISEQIYSQIPGSKKRHDIELHPSDQEALQNGEITVAIGGDGTILKAADIVRAVNHPLLGINSGRLGFLANIHQHTMETALKEVIEGHYELDKRFFIEAEFHNGDHKIALNEFVFSRKGSASMVTLTAEYDGTFINRYWADGIIVSSPTGSTAYNLSTGGPIVLPRTNVMVLTPISPHTLTTRPLVLPSDKYLTIKVEPVDQKVLFSGDGNIYDLSVGPPVVNIRQSAHFIQLIKLSGQSYFETLRSKLMWGADVREKQ